MSREVAGKAPDAALRADVPDAVSALTPGSTTPASVATPTPGSVPGSVPAGHSPTPTRSPALSDRSGSPEPPRRTFAARRVTRSALIGLIAVVALAGLLGRAATEPPLQARLLAEPGSRVDSSPDLDRLGLVLVLTNPGRTARSVDDVRVTGIGPVHDGRQRGAVRIAGGASVRIPLEVAADCTLLDRGPPTVQAGRETLTPSGTDVRNLLTSLCPAPQPGPAVDVVATRADPTGAVVVRLVNHGGRTATIVAAEPAAAPEAGRIVPRMAVTPALPLTLETGRAVTLRLAVALPRCPAAGDRLLPDDLTVRSRTPEGDDVVGGWPAALIARASRLAAASCTG